VGEITDAEHDKEQRGGGARLTPRGDVPPDGKSRTQICDGMLACLWFSGIGAGIKTSMMPRGQWWVVRGGGGLMSNDGNVDLGPSLVQWDKTICPGRWRRRISQKATDFNFIFVALPTVLSSMELSGASSLNVQVLCQVKKPLS
jgi:hypothetical protein